MLVVEAPLFQLRQDSRDKSYQLLAGVILLRGRGLGGGGGGVIRREGLTRSVLSGCMSIDVPACNAYCIDGGSEVPNLRNWARGNSRKRLRAMYRRTT